MKIMDVVDVLGSIFGCAMTIVVFFTAIFANMNPDKSIRVYMNTYGEANIELMLMAVMLVFVLQHAVHVMSKKLLDTRQLIEDRLLPARE